MIRSKKLPLSFFFLSGKNIIPPTIQEHNNFFFWWEIFISTPYYWFKKAITILSVIQNKLVLTVLLPRNRFVLCDKDLQNMHVRLTIIELDTNLFYLDND